MREKMLFMIVLMTCVMGIQCSSPAGPDKDDYRNNVEFTYTRPDDAGLKPEGKDDVALQLELYDPAATAGFWGPTYHDSRFISMNKTGKNTYRCVVNKIYVQKPGEEKHEAGIGDCLKVSMATYAENISVQGAYDLETRIMRVGTTLLFRMAKN